MKIQRSPWSYTLLLTLFSLLLHMLVAGRIGLSADGAHYALYGLHLDWSYFDHPPMVGWLQSLVLFFSQGEFALRLIPMLLFAASGLALYYLTRLIFPDDSPWLAFWSVVVLQAGVIFHLIALAMLPDGPLLLLGILAMAMLWRAVKLQEAKAWIYLGGILGLAALSKYTAITLVVTVALFLLLTRRWGELLKPQLWLGVVIAGLLILPILLWNAANEWISFQYQLNHGFRNDTWEWSRFLMTQGAQFAVYSPVVYLLGLAVLTTVVIKARDNHAAMLLVLLVVPILLLFGWGAGYRESLPHWTSLAWAGVAPLVARWFVRGWQRRSVRVLAWLGGLYSASFILLLHSLFFYPWLDFPEKNHPLQDLHGWPEAMERAQSHLAVIAQKEPDAQLFVSNWSVASRAAWYARPTPVRVSDTRFDQFDLWFGSPEKGDGGLVVVPSMVDNPIEEGDLMGFADCRLVEELPIRYAGQTVSRYRYYHCIDFVVAEERHSPE